MPACWETSRGHWWQTGEPVSHDPVGLVQAMTPIIRKFGDPGVWRNAAQPMAGLDNTC